VRPCSGPQTDPAAAPTLTGWAGSTTQDPVKLIAVVEDAPRLYARNLDGSGVNHERDFALCPGTPITFTQYDVTGRTQASVTIPDFHLPADPRR